MHRDDRGATMVEYGLLLALIVILLIGLVEALGLSVVGWFQSAADSF